MLDSESVLWLVYALTMPVFVLGGILAFLMMSTLLGRRRLFSLGNVAVSGLFFAALAGLLFTVPVMVDQMTNTVLPDQVKYLPDISPSARGNYELFFSLPNFFPMTTECTFPVHLRIASGFVDC